MTRSTDPRMGSGESSAGNAARRTGSRLIVALVVTLAFVVIEAAAGLLANSLALLTDAGHNLTDVIALGLSWYAFRLTIQHSNSKKTYGYHRAGILVALVNSTSLVLIALGVFYEAYRRLLSPQAVKSEWLISVGLAAVVVNLATSLLVRRGSASDLNVRSVFLHLLGDVASTSGAVAAGIIIYFTGANWIDPLVSVLIGFAIVAGAWSILQETIEILLESTPRDVDMRAMVDELMKVQGVRGIHDLHVWSLNRNLRTMSAHILTEDVPISRGVEIQREVNAVVRQRYNISHATLQLECAGCDPDDLYCDLEGRALSGSGGGQTK